MQTKTQNYLAIDTSCNHLTVTASKGGKTVSVYKPDCAMRHSVSLMPAVEEALQKADLALEECDFFAAVVGAGSFTGIRIGISAAKGFCLAFSKPALPITSFDVAAYNAIDGEKRLCLVDAMHGYYYACGYQNGEVIYPPAYIDEAQVLSLVKDGYRVISVTALPALGGVTIETFSPAEGLEKAAAALSKKGAFGELNALYIRKSSAELNAEKAD